MKTKKQVQILLLITMAAAVPIAVAQTPAAEKPKTDEKVMKPGTLTATIGDSVTFSTLTKALKAAELDATLGAKGEFTIFAPTDDAFGKLPPEVLTKLMLPENKEKLRSLLLYHVVAGKVLAADLKDGDVKTMNGEKVKIDVESDKIEVDGSKVFSSDVMATNGVMHTIGEVLVPETLKEFIASLSK
jgi:uncharacterized surface protein with fasciclin (FAS1) repeats